MQNVDQVEECLGVLRAKLGFAAETQYPVGLILGTGLGQVAGDLEQSAVAFSELPHFPVSRASSHAGFLAATRLSGVPVLVQSGRCHLFEGFSPAEICMGVRVMHGMGVHTLVVTNAAGALNPDFEVDRLFLICDQINLTGVSPLTGINHEAWGVRFPDMSQVFDCHLRTLAQKTAINLGIALERGTYVGIHGPELETPAETRLYRALGGDAIGMSSVLEVICAKHLGMRILGFSCLTNKNLPDCMVEVAIEDIIASSQRAAKDLARLLLSLLPDLADKLAKD
ncbi:MAG: purine-nucleoside phosphorylase [Desulfovibrio sp.]|nr:purine-nucleoside phosphorylase [Desulfovibrio sp.]